MMQPLKFYIAVGAVGALADLGTNLYVSNAPIKAQGAIGLRDFYSKINPVSAMLFASLTFVTVVLIADGIVTLATKPK